jgi:SAM-dependent methyltransferase
VSVGERVPRADAASFDAKYAADPDPWGYTSSAYERDKYAATLAALPCPLGATLEVACSIGVFTALLAPRCERVLAIDFSSRALALARRRLRGLANVSLRQAAFPEQAPAGPWDAIVCSEVLYYLDAPALARAFDWLERALRGGACVVAVSWRGGDASSEPLRGDDVHDLLARRLAAWHVNDARTDGYRRDRFDGDGRA